MIVFILSLSLIRELTNGTGLGTCKTKTPIVLYQCLTKVHLTYVHGLLYHMKNHIWLDAIHVETFYTQCYCLIALQHMLEIDLHQNL